MGRPKKKLENLSITDGKLKEDPQTRFVPRTINDVLGISINPFSTTNEAEYKLSLAKMNKADLQMACIKLSAYPNDSRERMVETLLKKFRQHVASLDRSMITRNQIQKPMSEKLKQALSMGSN